MNEAVMLIGAKLTGMTLYFSQQVWGVLTSKVIPWLAMGKFVLNTSLFLVSARANGDVHVCGCETSPIIANLSELNGTESIEEDARNKFHIDKYCTDPEADDYMLHRTWKTEKEITQCAS